MTVRSASLSLAFAALSALPAWPQIGGPAPANIGSAASVTVGSGPHKGEYGFSPTQACVIAAFGKKPPGLSVVMSGEKSSLSIDVPNIDEAHASQLQVVLVIAASDAGKGPSSVTYEIDTRPDASLEPYQKAERATKGMSGKVTTTLMQKGDSALLSFSGETASGVKLEGSVTCKKI